MTDTKTPDLAWLNVSGNNQTWLDRPNVNHRAPYLPSSPAREHAEELVEALEYLLVNSQLEWGHDWDEGRDPVSVGRALLAKIKEQE